MVERPTYGKCRRNKIKEKSAPCNTLNGMDDLREAELINSRVKTEDFNLDQVATEAILKFSRIKDRKLNKAVFDMVKTALVTDIHPFTKAHLGCKPMPLHLVEDIIEFCSTGKVTPRPPKAKIVLDAENIELLMLMRDGGIGYAKAKAKPDKVTEIQKLCSRILKGVA